jgi:hypothetical protein
MAKAQYIGDPARTWPHRVIVRIQTFVEVMATDESGLAAGLHDLKLRGPHIRQHSITATGQYLIVGSGPCVVIHPVDTSE